MKICIIPARAGSTRIPGKNKKMFKGQPMFLHSVAKAEQYGSFDRIIVTTDDQEIKDICNNMKIEVHDRSQKGAQNATGTHDVCKEVLKDVGYEQYSTFVCCLYATSPLVSINDMRRGEYAVRAIPGLVIARSEDSVTHQDAGNFYWGHAEAFISHNMAEQVGIPIDSDRVCDINVQEDWNKAEQMYDKLRGL